MTWQLVSFALLLAVVVGGFVWWERSRPPARLVALVAALAALAVAGRLVFAPIPNLVATTDVALLTGYALGGAPGFAVGALAAPISNIWLGQGPWTAWQMAGWGLVGLGGAALAWATGRELGRLGLAVACGLAGFAYGALLDLSTMVTYGGEQSLDRYLALSAKGVPFNAVHAAGNFALALAAGPALVRLISRYQTRLTFTWRPAAAVPLILVVLTAPLLADPPTGSATEKRPEHLPMGGGTGRLAAGEAADWVVATQNTDGGFAASPDQPSSPAMTGWVMLGLEAAGINPLDVESGGEDPVSYLRAEAGRIRAATDIERTILALTAAGVDPRNFAGRDLVAQLEAKRDGDGAVDNQVNITAFYALAMRAAGVDSSRLERTRRWLIRAQAKDGGWGFQPGAGSDPDSTGAALQAIVAAGASGDPVRNAVRYLRRSQRPNGGFALSTSGVINSQSTAWAVQGMVAAGAGGKPRRDALAYIESLRASDGHYRYSSASDQTPIWVTTQALLALRMKAFPLARVQRQTASASSDSPSQPSTDAAGEPSTAPPSATGPVVGSGPGGSGKDGSGGGGADSSADGNGTAAGPGPAGSPSSAAPTPAVEPQATTAVAGETPVAQTPTPATDEPDDDSTLPWVIGGMTVLAALLAGGFVWYRNRLP